jgi:3-methyladenine DNA glycosylase AlkD
VRALGKAVANRHRADWQVRDAQAFADLLMRQPYLEVKGAGIETLACFRRAFTRSLLAGWKRWLATNCSANWATTDSICGSLISPLLHSYPGEVATVRGWATHRNMWVRRAAAVSLVRLAARGRSLDEAYEVATTLRPDTADLIHKAVGWLLREAGRTDPARLERHLLAHGPAIPRTTVRYAIEHYSPDRRKALLAATKAGAS